MELKYFKRKGFIYRSYAGLDANSSRPICVARLLHDVTIDGQLVTDNRLKKKKKKKN
jgi:hypothetical protein